MKKQTVVLLGTLLALSLSACDDARLKDITRVPTTLTITVSPPRGDFNVGESVLLGFVVLDQDGIIIDGLTPEWQVPAAPAVESLGGGSFRFAAVGAFTWSCSLAEYGLSDTVILNAAAVPATLEITVDPRKDFYGISEQVALGYVVRDADGTELTGIAATWQMPPAADVADLGQGNFEFLREGGHTWTVTLAAPWGLSESVTLVVDGGGPTLEIEVPERGDTIRMDNPGAQVTVMGTVEDSAAGLSAVTVQANGGAAAAAQVEANGTYLALITAEPGLNVIRVEALDEAGNSTAKTRAFYFSTDFFAYEDDLLDRARMPDMEDALITDLAMDRGSPLDSPPYDPCAHDGSDLYACSTYGDFASFLEVALNALDFTTMQPSLGFSFPLLDESWGLSLAGFATVTLSLTGTFDLDFAFEDVGVGEAKVTDLAAYNAGIKALVDFGPYTDSQGQTYAGLYAHLGMTGTLSFLAYIDLQTGMFDPVLCFAAGNICANGHCLSEYLAACTANPLPIASVISTISPQDNLLAGIDIDNMAIAADLLVGLDGNAQPEVSLARMDLTISQGALNLSALQGLVVDLGTAQFAGYGVDLGEFEIPLDFIADLAADLLTPLVDFMLPMIEPALEMIFSCADPQNPVCFVIPFFEHMLAAFAVDADLAPADPFGGADPLAVLHLTTGFEEIIFRTGFGGDLDLAGRLDAAMSTALLSHVDDDLLGVTMLGGCLDDDPGFTGQPTGGKGMQVAAALDLLNQGLFALWYGGGLELQLGEAAFTLTPDQAVTDLDLTVAPWLPVVLNHCTAANNQIDAQWGDVYLQLTFNRGGQTYLATGFASLSAAASLGLGGDGLLHLALSEADLFEFEFETFSVDGQAAFSGGPEAEVVRGLIRDALLPQLAAKTSDAVLASLQIVLPLFDLSVFPGIDPSMTVMGMTDLEAGLSQGRVVINGDLGQ